MLFECHKSNLAIEKHPPRQSRLPVDHESKVEECEEREKYHHFLLAARESEKTDRIVLICLSSRNLFDWITPTLFWSCDTATKDRVPTHRIGEDRYQSIRFLSYSFLFSRSPLVERERVFSSNKNWLRRGIDERASEREKRRKEKAEREREAEITRLSYRINILFIVAEKNLRLVFSPIHN